ncbi:hypothetical protein ACJX0J_001034 [Zea mays]
MNLIFFSIYRDRDIEFIGMLFTFHVLRIDILLSVLQASFGKTFEYPLEMGFINNFILKKGLEVQGFSERLVMVLYALFYVFLGFMGTDLWMKIQKRKWKPNS